MVRSSVNLITTKKIYILLCDKPILNSTFLLPMKSVKLCIISISIVDYLYKFFDTEGLSLSCFWRYSSRKFLGEIFALFLRLFT
jgi:hypothetical protein